MIDPRLAALTEADRLAADLAALRIEHEAVCGLLTHTRRDRDGAREAHIQAVKDNVSLRVSVGVLDGTVAGLKAQRDEARCERDDARDETQRLWDATEADRARMAELESRPTYEDGVREAIVDLDPLAYAYLLAREKAHNAPLGATGGAGGPHMALHRADMAWQAIGCRALAVAPETPASDLAGLAGVVEAVRAGVRRENREDTT